MKFGTEVRVTLRAIINIAHVEYRAIVTSVAVGYSLYKLFAVFSIVFPLRALGNQWISLLVNGLLVGNSH